MKWILVLICLSVKVASFEVSYSMHQSTDVNCTNPTSVYYIENDECHSIRSSSGRLHCVSQSVGSDWTWEYWNSERACPGSASRVVNGTGPVCIDSQTNNYMQVFCDGGGDASNSNSMPPSVETPSMYQNSPGVHAVPVLYFISLGVVFLV